MSDSRQHTRPPAVVVETRGPAAILRLDRPRERNPLSASTLDELERALDSLAPRTGLRAIIFTGTGDAFASGADIRELRSLAPGAAAEFARRGQRLTQKISDAAALTVAAVGGYCMGGGLDLALACDLRVASRSSTFAHPGARLGIITGWGGTQRLPRLVGDARALEMFLTARRVSGAEALEIGLVNRLCDDPLDCALKLVAGWNGKGGGG